MNIPGGILLQQEFSTSGRAGVSETDDGGTGIFRPPRSSHYANDWEELVVWEVWELV
jgi:hypothetical protein